MARLTLLLLVTFLILPGCSGQQQARVTEFEDKLSLSGIGSLSIEIDSGTLYIGSTEAEELFLNGELADLGSLKIDRDDSIFGIELKDTLPIDIIRIQVPRGIALNIKTFSADAIVEGFSGELKLDSSAGNIHITGFSGKATVWAGRGGIALSDSQGEAILISEHGAVTVNRFSGEISMSTIMGSLTYSGMENEQNMVRMEADHGPVTANFPANANSIVSASSTSGETACIGPGISYTIDGCQANMGTGAGSVKIRTVSGRIEVRIMGISED